MGGAIGIKRKDSAWGKILGFPLGGPPGRHSGTNDTCFDKHNGRCAKEKDKGNQTIDMTVEYGGTRVNTVK